MTAFQDFWKNKMHKQSSGQRLAAIDFLLVEIISQMQAVVDPTKWNVLLDKKAELEAEREEIVARSGTFKMQ